MTKKDFELIATSFKRTLQTITATAMPDQAVAQLRAVSFAAIQLATDLHTTNARFDKERFLAACGVDNSVFSSDAPKKGKK